MSGNSLSVALSPGGLAAAERTEGSALRNLGTATGLAETYRKVVAPTAYIETEVDRIAASQRAQRRARTLDLCYFHPRARYECARM